MIKDKILNPEIYTFEKSKSEKKSVEFIIIVAIRLAEDAKMEVIKDETREKKVNTNPSATIMATNGTTIRFAIIEIKANL